jgi:hypothetical protein
MPVTKRQLVGTRHSLVAALDHVLREQPGTVHRKALALHVGGYGKATWHMQCCAVELMLC